MADIGQEVKDAAEKVKENLKVGKEHSEEKVTDTGAKTDQNVKKILGR